MLTSTIFKIISSSSHGNATVLNSVVLVDCGVNWKRLKPHILPLQYVFLTHCHTDHFKSKTITRLADERPSLQWICGPWLVEKLVECGVRKKNINPFQTGKSYAVGKFKYMPFKLYHDVPNCGYAFNFNGYRVLYATDTATMDGISAKNFDLYMIEANYGEEEIEERISRKTEEGKYCYEYRAKRNHLSREACDRWLLDNIGDNSQVVYMHQHEEVNNE